MKKKTVEVIVGRQLESDPPAEQRVNAIKGSPACPAPGEVEGRTDQQKLVMCPYDGSIFYVDIPDDGKVHIVFCPNGGQTFYV